MDDQTARPSGADSLFPGRGSTHPRRPPSRSRTVILVLVVAGLAALAAFGLSKCAGHGAAGGGRRQPTTVGVAKAVNADVPIQLDALGTVTPRATVTVTSRIAGTLVRVAFREGQMVRAGQVIAQVDDRPYAIALEQAQGQLMRDQAALTNAQLLLSRDQTLLAQDSIARQDADTQAATVKQDQGVVKTDKAAVDSARLNLGYCRIVAPVSGKIGLRQVDVGNYVTAGSSAGIAVITQIDPIDVVFTIPEDQVQTIAARMRSGAVLPVSALDRAGGTALAQGVLSTLDNQVDVSTGTMKAKAAFSNAGGALFANQFVNVRVLVSTVQTAVVIPASAIRHGPQGDFVWILQPDKTAHMQTVTVGPTAGEQASIQSGVQAGQTVITEGGDRLREGAPVVLPGQRPSFGAGGKSGGRGGHGKGAGRHRGGGQGGGGQGGGGQGGGGDGG